MTLTKWYIMVKSGEEWGAHESIGHSRLTPHEIQTAMFIGEFRHTIDDKGRLAIPVAFRRSLKKCVVTRGLDACLFVYTPSEWDVIARKLAALPLTQASARAFARLMLAGAMELATDGQGRVLVPDYLRVHANLQKNVVVAGLYNRVEVWPEDAWNRYTAKVVKTSSNIAEQLAALGV